MTDELAIPIIVAMLVSYWACLMAPFLLSLFYAIFRGRGVPRRYLFVGAASALSYGLLIFFFVAFALPIILAGEYLIPELMHMHPEYPLQWFDLLYVFFRWWRLTAMIASLASAVVVVRWLWSRWPRLVNALG